MTVTDLSPQPARGFRRLTRDRQRDAIPLPAANLARPVAGSAPAGRLPPLWRAGRAEAEHELSLFDCLRVWGYCIDRCYLVNPPFVRRHLAVN